MAGYSEVNTVTTFLLPLLNIEPIVFKGRIINSYLQDTDVELYKENHIFVVHSNKQDPEFRYFEEILCRHENFVDSYDIVDSFFGVKVFKIPEKFKDEYYYFMRGKYSKYGLAARGMVFKCGLLPDNRILHHVFTKSEELRSLKETSLGISLTSESELWSIWDPQIDVLNSDIKEFLKGLCKTKLSPNLNFLD